jgi:hypothetical protein
MELDRIQSQQVKHPEKTRSEGIKSLKELALAHSRSKHPTLPDYARTIHSYSDRTANGLTRAVIDFLNFSGHQAERINSTGRYKDNSSVVKDVLGTSRRIGSGQWIPGAGIRGTADISATIWGKSVKIEIKINDRQSDDQKKYQAMIERAAGHYWLIRSFDEFLDHYHELI